MTSPSTTARPFAARILQVLAAAVLLAALAACSGWNAKAPPHTTATQPVVNVPDSRIGVDIGVNLSAVARSVASTYSSKPLSQGQTDYVRITLNVDHKGVDQVLKDYVETPYKAAACVTVIVTKDCVKHEAQSVADNCFKHFRIDRCFKTVWLDTHFPCTEEVQQCTPEIKEVVKSRLEAVDVIRDEILPTSARLNHKLTLTGLAASVQGSNIAVKAGLHLNLSADIKQGFLDASMTVKGALDCDIDTSVSAVLSTAITTAPALDVQLEDFDLDLKKICVPGAIEIADAALLDANLYIQRAVLEPILHDAIVKELNKQLQKSLGNSLDFADELKSLSADAAQPLKLSDDAWLLVNPTGLAISQFDGEDRGGDNWLSLFAALSAKPVVVGGSQPAASPVAALPVTLTNEKTSAITFAAKGTVPLKQIEDRLLATIKDFSNDPKYKDIPLTISDVDVYQSGAKLAIGLTVAQRQNPKAVEGQIYLSARPEFDTASGKLRLRDVSFDLDSRRVIAKTAAWLLDSKIEDLIADKVDIDYAGPLANLQAKYASYGQTRNGLTYIGALQSIKAGDIWVADDSLNVWAVATGTLHVTVAPQI